MLVLSLALGHLVISMAYPAHVCFSHQRHLHVVRKHRPLNLPRTILEPHKFQPAIGRSFFFSSSSGSDGDGGDEKKNDHEDKEPSTASKSRMVTTTDSESPTSSSPVAVGVGDEALRPSPLVILPLDRKPLFPGTSQTLSIQHPPTINKFNKMFEKGGNNYVGLFLRKQDTSSEKDINTVIKEVSEVYETGTLAQFFPLPTQATGDESTLHVILRGHRRINLKHAVKQGPPMVAEVEHWDVLPPPSKLEADMVKALSSELVEILREILRLNPMFREQTEYYFARLDMSNPYLLADIAASLTTADGHELQRIMEEKSPVERLRKALLLLSTEREVLRLQRKISKEIEAKMTKQQREYLLKEQLKTIKKELGYEQDDKEALLQKFRERLEAAEDVPKAARKVIEEELNKLEHLEKNSPEFNTSRNYLDWLTSLPWGKATLDTFDVVRAKQMLDDDHYGLDDVKERILEFIAVGKLRGALTGEEGSSNGKIMCLVGPPGVGKTSIAKSVANALGRKFYRFSVGGLSDVAEIKGHRRTYVGAMPGKVVMALKDTQTANPLILIDEIDKLGKGYQGDPASALLELLDPAQNSAFTDNFLDTPVDMSKALFLCTANVLDTIPGPLLDRMEIVRLSGYDMPEKVEIASKYLIPKALQEAGLQIPKVNQSESCFNITNAIKDDDLEKEVRDALLKAKQAKLKPSHTNEDDDEDKSDEMNEEIKVRNEMKLKEEKEKKLKFRKENAIPDDIAAQITINQDAVWSLVRWYCREAGVRNLAQKIEQISRKLALDVVKYQAGGLNATVTGAPKAGWVVNDENLKDFVGKPVFTQDRLYEGQPPPGVVMGLAWTSMGGTNLYVEVTEIPGVPNGTGGRFIVANSTDEDKPQATGSLITTGQMGDVMKESTRIAYTFARNFLNRRCVGQQDNSYLATNQIHLHVPEGATPKDGPSAGVTMVSAMLGLAMNKSVRHDVAMTGEVSLTGKVLPVGGIKEKTIAARRAGITCMVIPAANRKDMEELPDYLKDGLEVHYADSYDDVYTVAFCEDPDGVPSFDP